MAIRKPVVVGSNGLLQQLQSTDEIDAATADASVRSATNGESSLAIVIGAPAYISGAGAVKNAKADALATADVWGLMRTTSVAAGGTGQLVTDGPLTATTAQWDAVTGQVGGLTPGSRYFLDPATAGKMTVTAPTTVGQVVMLLGKALSTTEFEVDTDIPILL